MIYLLLIPLTPNQTEKYEFLSFLLLNLLPAINLSCLSGWGTFQLNPQLLVDNSCGFGWGVLHFNGHVILSDGDFIMLNYFSLIFLILIPPPLDCGVELLPGPVAGSLGNAWPWGGSALDQRIYIQFLIQPSVSTLSVDDMSIWWLWFFISR